MTHHPSTRTLVIALTSGCGAHCDITFTRGAEQGTIRSDGSWDTEPVLGTESASLTLTADGVESSVDLTGGQWRSLEDNELIDDLVEKVLVSGLALDLAVQQTLTDGDGASYEVICYASKEDFEQARFCETTEGIETLAKARWFATYHLASYPIVKIQSTSQETGEVIHRDAKALELAAGAEQAQDAVVTDAMPLLQAAVALRDLLGSNGAVSVAARQQAEALVIGLQKLAIALPIKAVSVSGVDGFETDALVLVPGWMDDAEADRRIEEGIVAANLAQGKFADLDDVAAEWRKRGILHQQTRTASSVAWDCTFATAVDALPAVLQCRAG